MTGPVFVYRTVCTTRLDYVRTNLHTSVEGDEGVVFVLPSKSENHGAVPYYVGLWDQFGSGSFINSSQSWMAITIGYQYRIGLWDYGATLARILWIRPIVPQRPWMKEGPSSLGLLTGGKRFLTRFISLLRPPPTIIAHTDRRSSW
jgi:hypothetical protein